MIQDISWECFTQYAGLGVVTGISIGFTAWAWNYFVTRVRDFMVAAVRSGSDF